MSLSRLVILAASVFQISCEKQTDRQTNADENRPQRLPSAWVITKSKNNYDTIRYIYVRSKADKMASLVYRTAQKQKISKN